VKYKIIEKLLAHREYCDTKKRFVLDQSQVVELLSNIWNYALPCPLNNAGNGVATMPKDDKKSFSALSFSTSSTRKRRPKKKN